MRVLQNESVYVHDTRRGRIQDTLQKLRGGYEKDYKRQEGKAERVRAEHHIGGKTNERSSSIYAYYSDGVRCGVYSVAYCRNGDYACGRVRR